MIGERRWNTNYSINSGLVGGKKEYKKSVNILKDLICSNIFQILPIWLMILLQMVSKYYFDIKDYTENLLVFTIVACITNLADSYGEDNKEKFISSAILCCAIFLYTLILLSKFTELDLKFIIIFVFAIIFAVCVIMIGYLQEKRKEEKK